MLGHWYAYETRVLLKVKVNYKLSVIILLCTDNRTEGAHLLLVEPPQGHPPFRNTIEVGFALYSKIYGCE
jgi:hypothetical protein